MAARASAPVIGGQGSYLRPGETQVSFGYRWQQSDRHFRGDSEQEDRQSEHSEVINDVHLFDLGVTHALSRRFSLSVSLPVLVAERSQPIRSGGVIVDRNVTNSRGIGDLSVLARGWIFDPDEHADGNVQLGLGAKFPTGEDDVTDTFYAADGSSEKRTVDQSIQPGDGGYGIVANLNAFQSAGRWGSLYLQGSYLANPRGKNGVPTFRSNPREAEMSVPDQFLARAGIARLIPWHPIESSDGLSLTLGARAEGVPVRDLIGPSTGFRRPGIAVSAEPGIVYSFRKLDFGLTAPIAVYRNRWRSVPDKRTPGRHGDAAFADYLILFGVNWRFGGGGHSETLASVEPRVASAAASRGRSQWRPCGSG